MERTWRTAAGLSTVLAGSVLLNPIGCKTSPSVPAATTAPVAAPPGVDPALRLEIIEAHNDRVAALARMHARGVIEFRWIDSEGKEHFEPQVNARLWLELPRSTALRAEKLGEVLFWLGSDEDRYWLFDRMSDEKGVVVRAHEDPVLGATRTPLLIRPLALIDLLGLTPVDPAQATVEAGPNDGWTITAPGAGGGAMRLVLDAARRAIEVTAFAPERAGTSMSSTLQRYRSVEQPGELSVNWPSAPTLIDLSDALLDQEATIQIKLALDAPVGNVKDEPWSTVFDFSRLETYFGE